MKINYLFTGLITAAALFGSCEADDTADIVINSTDNSVVNNNGGNTPTTPTGEQINLTGTYDSDLTLDPNNTYTITGSMIMAEGTTLTIPAGTTLNAFAGGANVYIAISQGAKIDAQGTADEPIVMTSGASSARPGDWGGLILLGKAPVNSADVSAGAFATSEIGNLKYGGVDEADNSGILSYVRVEYSGAAADGQSENNGFSFYGVGNGTTVEYIEAFKGTDDGVEFFGGTVNANHIVVIDCEDDSIDYTEGYSGTLTDVYIRHGEEHDHGIEADGYSPDSGNNANPEYFANPIFENFTINGIGENNGLRAILLREGTQGTFTNFVVNDFQIGVQIRGDDSAGPTAQQILDDNLNINNIAFNNVGTLLDVPAEDNSGPAFTIDQLITEGEATGTDYATWGIGWTIQ
ncbi:hypothetical protein [Flavimarina sp. Hel_I_48]|uniref:hypothetical protein n=1 Tax=Flavimarina sp. Hel_I_48 TaxID=1392488 RepID=UPI0004DEE9C8|nr:hypothetical protein [Flavimarina sp. Hel_I_48]